MLELPTPKTQSFTADLTALLDVLFIVLVFLMLSVAVKLNVLEVSLPSAGHSGNIALKHPPKVISLVYANSQVSYALDEQTYSTLNTLMPALSSITSDHTVFVAVDKRVPSEQLVALFAQLSEREIHIANIIVKSE